MHSFSMICSAAILLTGASLAFGQPVPAPPPRPETAPSGQDTLRGVDLQDYVAVCVLEARLACFKRAVAEKIRPPARRDFISKCMGS